MTFEANDLAHFCYLPPHEAQGHSTTPGSLCKQYVGYVTKYCVRSRCSKSGTPVNARCNTFHAFSRFNSSLGSSSAVEHPPVKRCVAGSNPALPANSPPSWIASSDARPAASPAPQPVSAAGNSFGIQSSCGGSCPTIAASLIGEPKSLRQPSSPVAIGQRVNPTGPQDPTCGVTALACGRAVTFATSPSGALVQERPDTSFSLIANRSSAFLMRAFIPTSEKRTQAPQSSSSFTA